MGKPGGFFKRLKAKQKRAASKRSRGTKGASKEERIRKRNERVDYYAARRQAEQLAEVSASSDDEASTDSEELLSRDERQLRRLRRMLGVHTGGSAAAAASKNSVKGKKRAAAAGAGAAAGRQRRSGSNSNSSGSVDGSSSEEEDEEAEVARKRNARQQRKRRRVERLLEDDRRAARDGSSDGDGSSSSSAGDEYGAGSERSGGSREDTEEDEGSVADEFLYDDADDDNDDGDSLDATMFGDEGSEAGGGGGADEEREYEDALAQALFDEVNGVPPQGGEEEEEEEEEEGESDFQDEDEDADEAAATAGRRLLLPRFRPQAASAESLRECAALAVDPADPWFAKYHADTHGEVDRTPLAPVPLPPRAAEALKHANDAIHAELARQEREEVPLLTPEERRARRRNVNILESADYETVHPENVAVAASESARAHLLHAPFDIPSGAGAETGAKDGGGAAATQRPPHVHESLWAKWVAFREEEGRPVLTAEERGLLDLLLGYPDVLDTLRVWQNAASRREIFCLHMLNHWFKARAVVVAHNQMLAQHRRKARERARARRRRRQLQQKREAAARDGDAEEEEDERQGRRRRGSEATAPAKTDVGSDGDSEDDNDEDDDDLEGIELRDRGFSKCRLLMMLPMRNAAYNYVYTLCRVLGADPARCSKLAGFERDFTELEGDIDPNFHRRPRDYQRQFDGNIDDSFCVGVRLEPDRLHVYAHPLNSDLLICSPLGLRRRLEKSGELSVALSAIEVCLVDEAHVLLQQNWDHAAAVMGLLNKRPTDTTFGLSDLRRVYAWALEGKAGRHRQTVISTQLSHAQLLSTWRAACFNNSGRVLLQRADEGGGALAMVAKPVRQHFVRVEQRSLETAGDDRFEYFRTVLFPERLNPLAEREVRVLLLVPTYLEFVRVRNFLHREYRDVAATLSEYSSVRQQRQALGQFSDLERPILLMTERFYFFKRYFVKMAEVVIFYSPPMFPEFYLALIHRMVDASPNAFVLTLFGKYDTHELCRIVGANRMRQMLERESGIFSFVTN